MRQFMRKIHSMTRSLFTISTPIIPQSYRSLQIPLFNLPRGVFQPDSSSGIRWFCSKYRIEATTMQNPESISYLTQRQAAEVDEILMGPLGFNVDQLMELAGLSVATSIAESSVVPGRHFLIDKYKELEDRFSNGLRYSPYDIDGKKVWKAERLAPRLAPSSS